MKAMQIRRFAARAFLLAAALVGLAVLSPPALAALPKGIAFGDEPSWVEVVPVDALEPAVAADGLAYRVVEDQVSLLGDEPVEYRRLVYDIADRGGLEGGGRVRISFHPDYQRVTVHALAVVRDGRSFDRRADTRVELLRLEQRADDGILDGRRTAEFLMPDVQVGDRVDIAYSVTGGNPVFGRGFHTTFYTTYSQAMAARRIRAVMPEGQRLSWKIPTGPGTFEESVRDGRRELLLDLVDVPAVVEEGALPARFDPYGVVEMSTARDWSDVARWSVALFKLGPPGTGAVAAQARALGLAGKPAAEATREALAFVQREVRYVSLSIGESSHAPAAPETTLSRRFGDCKDKSLLMVGLLAEAGIEAEPVLVNTRWREDTNGRLASPLAFDHAIVRARLDGEWHYFDPTRDTEVGTFAQRGPVDFGAGLPVSAGTQALVDIPMPERPEPEVEVSQDVTLVGADGEERADIRVRTLYRYGQASQLRQRFRADPAEAIGKQYQDYMQSWYRDIEQVSPPETTDTPEHNLFEVAEHYRAPFEKDEDEPARIGDFNLRLFQIADWVPEARETSRKQPLRLPGPERGVQEIRMALEGGWDIEPEAHEISNDYFRFRLKVSARDERLTMTGEWDRLAEAVPPEDYPRVRDDLRKVRDLLGYSVRVGGGGTAGSTLDVGPRDLTWPALALLATTVMLAGLWWLRDRSRIAGMFFAPRNAAERLLGKPSAIAAIGVVALWALVNLLVGIVPAALAGEDLDWAALGLESLVVFPQVLIGTALLYGLFRALDSRPAFRSLFITASWSLWPLILLTPLAMLAAGPVVSLLAGDAPEFAWDSAVGWLLLMAMLLMLLLGIAWSLVSAVAAHSVAARCDIGRSIVAYVLAVVAFIALAFVVILPYVLYTGGFPAA